MDEIWLFRLIDLQQKNRPSTSSLLFFESVPRWILNICVLLWHFWIKKFAKWNNVKT